jgi:hypothetical protein
MVLSYSMRIAFIYYSIMTLQCLLQSIIRNHNRNHNHNHNCNLNLKVFSLGIAVICSLVLFFHFRFLFNTAVLYYKLCNGITKSLNFDVEKSLEELIVALCQAEKKMNHESYAFLYTASGIPINSTIKERNRGTVEQENSSLISFYCVLIFFCFSPSVPDRIKEWRYDLRCFRRKLQSDPISWSGRRA